MTGTYGYTDELISLPLSFDAQIERRREWLTAMKCPDCGKTMAKGKPCATCKKKAPAKGKPMPKGKAKPKWGGPTGSDGRDL